MEVNDDDTESDSFDSSNEDTPNDWRSSAKKPKSKKSTKHEMSGLKVSPDLDKVQIGSRVEVLRSDDEEYYQATVTQEERSKKRPLSLLYDSGESEWVDLRQHKFRLIEEAPCSAVDQEYPNGTRVKAVCIYD